MSNVIIKSLLYEYFNIKESDKMHKYKVCVYAISKNESKFVDRWIDSMQEADKIFVLDTGSTDDTVDKLKTRGVVVETKVFNTWRFDNARNASLDMVDIDTDICVCTDLDEVLEKGWRQKLEDAWNDKVTRARYNYNWKLDEKGKPIVNFYTDKIHKRCGYKWTHPVHEVLKYNKDYENIITIDGIVLNHYPDVSKSRGSYLSLLELSVEEDPEDDRNMHYLGREYMYHQRWNECIDTLIRHLSLKSATWRDERCASMRFISRSYQALNRYEEARMWLDKAINEAPYLREPYIERAILEYKQNNYKDVIKYAEEALKITKHDKTYINEVFSWDNTVYDLLSVAYFNEGKMDKALENVNLALKMDKDNKRLKNNKRIIENVIK